MAIFAAAIFGNEKSLAYHANFILILESNEFKLTKKIITDKTKQKFSHSSTLFVCFFKIVSKDVVQKYLKFDYKYVSLNIFYLI